MITILALAHAADAVKVTADNDIRPEPTSRVKNDIEKLDCFGVNINPLGT